MGWRLGLGILALLAGALLVGRGPTSSGCRQLAEKRTSDCGRSICRCTWRPLAHFARQPDGTTRQRASHAGPSERAPPASHYPLGEGRPAGSGKSERLLRRFCQS